MIQLDGSHNFSAGFNLNHQLDKELDVLTVDVRGLRLGKY